MSGDVGAEVAACANCDFMDDGLPCEYHRGHADAMERVEAAKAEALREAAAKVTARAGDGPVRLVTVRRWLNDRAAALDPGPRP